MGCPREDSANAPAMQLDLRRDYAEIYAHLVARVSSFDPVRNIGPGKGQTVKMIEVGYEYDQMAWVAVVFDTRPDAEPDGEWTLYAGNEFDRPHWLEANNLLFEHPISLVLWDGTNVDLLADDREEFGRILGRMLLSILLHAREDGVFTALPKTSDCELGVEHLNGVFGWPPYERRGELGRV